MQTLINGDEQRLSSIPEYIQQCFKAYLLSKTQIILNLWCIDKWFKDFKTFVFDHNMIKLEILTLFPNINNIIIFASSRNGKHEYLFDLIKLIDFIHYFKHDVIIQVRAKWKRNHYYCLSDDEESDNDDNDRSWIFNQYQSLIIKDYNILNDINTSLLICGKYNNEDCLVIHKIKNLN